MNRTWTVEQVVAAGACYTRRRITDLWAEAWAVWADAERHLDETVDSPDVNGGRR